MKRMTLTAAPAAIFLARYERRLEEAIKLHRFVHKSVMYEIREEKPTPYP